MKRLIHLLVFSFCCTALQIQAQDKIWSLNDCLSYAVAHSSKISNQQAQNSIYHQNFMEAVGSLLPSLKAYTTTYLNFGRGLDAETNTYIDNNSFSNSYVIYSSLTLFDGLSGINKVKMQKINKLKGILQLQNIIDATAYDTMEAFFNVVYFQEMIKLAEQQLAESSQQLVQIKKMQQLGMKSAPDVAEIASKEAADQYNLTHRQNIYRIGIIQLKEKMNFPIEDELQVKFEADLPLPTKEQTTALDIFQTAQENNPKLQISAKALHAQDMAYKSARGSLWPTINAEAGWSTNFARYMDGSDYRSFKEQFHEKRGYYVGFTLSIPLFSGFSRSAGIRRNKALLIITQNDYNDARRTLYAEIAQAITDMNGLADEYAQAGKQTAAAEEAYRMNQQKYKQGLVSILDLHTSENKRQEARINRLNARFKYELKSRLVEYYKGKPLFESVNQ